MPMQFAVAAWTEAGEGEWSEILEIVAIDYCDEAAGESCDFASFYGDDAEEFYEYPWGWIGDDVSETQYHLMWDAPYDPYEFWGAPIGYIIYSDNFQPGGRGERWEAVAVSEGSEEWGNSWKFDITNDMMVESCTYAPNDDGSYPEHEEPPSFDELS